MRGIEVDIPRTLTKRSHVLPLPEGEGGVRGKALFDSPSRLPSLLFHRKKTEIHRVNDANASSSFVEQPASAAGGVLLGERAGVRGTGTPAVLATSALDSGPEDRPKGQMVLSHSSFQASGFPGGR